MVFLFIIFLYFVIGAIVCGYVVAKDSKYLLDSKTTSGNLGLLAFAIVFWPLMYAYALGDSIERQHAERNKS